MIVRIRSQKISYVKSVFLINPDFYTIIVNKKHLFPQPYALRSNPFTI